MSKKKTPTKIQLKCEHCSGKGYILVNTIAALRLKSGMSQQEVADIVGLTRVSISNIERGVQAITTENIKKFAVLFDISEHKMYDIAAGATSDDAVVAKSEYRKKLIPKAQQS